MVMPDFTWHEFAFLLLALLSAVVAGLAAVWIALGRGHWFLRVAMVAAVLLPLVLVPAFDLLVIPTLQLLLTVPVLVIARRLRQRAAGRPAWQFGIRDLLLLTLVVATIAAVGAGTPRDVGQADALMIGVPGYSRSWNTASISHWVYLLGFAATIAAATCLSVWVALGRAPRRIRLSVLLLAIPLAAGIAEWIYRATMTPPPMVGATLPTVSSYVLPDLAFVETLILYALATTALITLWLWLARTSPGRLAPASDFQASPDRSRGAWLRRAARTGLFLMTFVLVAPLAMLYVVLLTRPGVPQTALPHANGYARLVELGTQLDNVTVPERNIPSRAGTPRQVALQDYINFERRHRDLLDAARAALDLPSQVPVSYKEVDFTLRSDDARRFRQLARAMRAAGEAARIDGRPDEASRWHVDLIRLGRRAGDGGLLIDWFVDKAIEDIGRQGLHRDNASLTPERRAEVVATLGRMREEGESVDTVQRRDDVYSQRAFGWRGRVIYCISELTDQNDRIRQTCRESSLRNRALHRVLLAELALENHRTRHREYPDRLDALVPDDLDKLPLDPFTDRPLIYRRTATGYLLYSVGPNRQDDGGATLNATVPAGDDVRFE